MSAPSVEHRARTLRVERHICPDETASVVNGVWVCHCPGGPYPFVPPQARCEVNSEEYEMKCTNCDQPWIEPTEERACCPNPTKPRAGTDQQPSALDKYNADLGRALRAAGVGQRPQETCDMQSVIPSVLESGLAKLRECADKTMFAEVTHGEAAALLARLGALETEARRLREDVLPSLVDALSRIDYLCCDPNEMEVSDFDLHCNEQLVVEAVQKRIADLSKAADKWQALMSCQRIRVLGSCLLEGEDYGHIGLEVWTHYINLTDGTDKQDREILEQFIERARRAEDAR